MASSKCNRKDLGHSNFTQSLAFIARLPTHDTYWYTTIEMLMLRYILWSIGGLQTRFGHTLTLHT